MVPAEQWNTIDIFLNQKSIYYAVFITWLFHKIIENYEKQKLAFRCIETMLRRSSGSNPMGRPWTRHFTRWQIVRPGGIRSVILWWSSEWGFSRSHDCGLVVEWERMELCRRSLLSLALVCDQVILTKEMTELDR